MSPTSTPSSVDMSDALERFSEPCIYCAGAYTIQLSIVTAQKAPPLTTVKSYHKHSKHLPVRSEERRVGKECRL